MKHATHFSLTMSFALLLTVTGCMEETPKSSIQVEGKAIETIEPLVIENLAENIVVGSYRDLRDQTRTLAELALALQKNPTQAALEAAQGQWFKARIPWESTEGFLFGPVDSLGIDPSIDSWPLSKFDLDKILVEQPNITAAFVRSLGTDVQGFHTAEYLLFGDGVESNTKSIANMTSAQLAYLAAVTQVLAEQTEKLLRAWTENHDPENPHARPFGELIRSPGFDNPFYPSRSAVFQEYVQGMIKIAAEVGKGKLADPLGGSIEAADASLVESQFSWNSLVDFQNNVRSMRNLYTGDRDTKGPGLDEIVKLRSPALNEKILLQIEAAENAIRRIGGTDGISFTKAIRTADGRERSLEAIETLATLEATLTNELLPVFK